MQTTTSQKVKIGVFTVVGILLFVIGIFLIGSKKNMFTSTFMIYGTFSNVGGLNVGNNIRFAGINVGTVEAISIVSDTMIRVDMRMQEQVRPFLKADAMASIGSDGLMGDKLITIKPGSASQIQLLNNGSRILTANPVDFDKIINTFTQVADNANVITGQLAKMATQIQQGDGSINKLLYSDDLAVSLQGSATNAERLTGSLANITAQVKSGKGSIGSLLYTEDLSNKLENTASSADKALATINDAAYGFSENMKALQGNFFLRGYFKRKEREKQKNATSDSTKLAAQPVDGLDQDLEEDELKEIIAEAQKALDAKKKKQQ